MGVYWPRTIKKKRRESGPEKHARGKRDPIFFLPNGGEFHGDEYHGIHQSVKNHQENKSQKSPIMFRPSLPVIPVEVSLVFWVGFEGPPSYLLRGWSLEAYFEVQDT